MIVGTMPILCGYLPDIETLHYDTATNYWFAVGRVEGENSSLHASSFRSGQDHEALP